MNAILLINGPHHGRRVPDLGKITIRMGIASRRDSRGLPAPGARSGLASYEPSPCRRLAYWLGNEWTGHTLATLPL